MPQLTPLIPQAITLSFLLLRWLLKSRQQLPLHHEELDHNLWAPEQHRQANSFSDDSSKDDGCIALEVASDRKGGMSSFAGISQQLLSGPSGTLLYTVQLYYAVISARGSWPCRLDAYLGDQQVCSETLSASGSMSSSWQRVLTTVEADSYRTDFGITISCLGSGAAMVYVNSVFISNQVTADNINNYHLAFEDM